MIWITGDIHGSYDIRKLSSERWPEGRSLGDDDFLIICGDFGMPWTGSNDEKHWLGWLNEKPWTTLYVDGNHECYPYLEDLPVTRRWGGDVQRYPDYPSVFRLMRGQVFELQGLTFFTMGGASSHDKEYRVEGESWWVEELPSLAEYETAERNLDTCGWKVDYVVSHCCSSRMLSRALAAGGGPRRAVYDGLSDWFNELEEKLEFKRWFFGHCHGDKLIDEWHRLLYQDIVRVV